jgi:hypothetical protein
MPTDKPLWVTLYAIPWLVDSKDRQNCSYGWLCSLRVGLKNRNFVTQISLSYKRVAVFKGSFQENPKSYK